MTWTLSHRAGKSVLPLADAHYSRQKPGTPQFVPPGRCIVLRAIRRRKVRAYWVTSWPFAEYTKHEWAGAWVCSAFRNVGAGLSSQLITEAVAATRYEWPDVPKVWAAEISAHVGIVSFIDTEKTKAKETPGRCYLKAGWEYIGKTQAGLIAVGQRPELMPAAQPAKGMQAALFASPLPLAAGSERGRT